MNKSWVVFVCTWCLLSVFLPLAQAEVYTSSVSIELDGVLYENGDDDDANLVVDADQDAVVSGENDLVRLILTVGLEDIDPPSLYGRQDYTYSLTYNTQYMRLWSSSTKGSSTTDVISSGVSYSGETFQLGDADGDGIVDVFDSTGLNLALSDPDAYQTQYGFDPDVILDINQDGTYDQADLDLILADMTSRTYHYLPLELWVEGLQPTIQSIDLTISVDFEDESISDYTETITVAVQSMDEMSVSVASTVQGGETFTATIQSQELGTSLSNTRVSFNSEIHYTNTAGQVSFTAPQTDGVYTVSIHKDGYVFVSQDITVEYTSPEEYQLSLIAPSSVFENESFRVTVTAKNIPVSDVMVSFLTQQQTTDDQGHCSFTSPEISNPSQTVTIRATKQEYTSALATIIIINQDEQQEPRAHFFGSVASYNADSLSDVRICAVSASEERFCVFSDEQGEYLLTLSPGIYVLEARHSGYQTSQQGPFTIDEEALNVNFILSTQTKPSTSTQQDIIDYTILYGIENDFITGELHATDIESQPQITLYNSDFSMQSLSSSDEELYRFTVTGPDDHPGTIFVVELSDEILQSKIADVQDFVVQLDGETVPLVQSISSLFSVEKSNSSAFTVVITEEGATLLIYVPHFSTHTISISAIEEFIWMVGGPVAVMLYSLICLVGIAGFVYPFVIWPRNIRKGKM